MVDLVGTCPMDFWEEWIAEGDPAGSPESGEEWGWFTEHSYRSLIKPGERFYVVAHGKLRGWSPVTRIPQSPPQVLGVLNLRGAIVPIIDLRLRFALASAEFTPVTVIIVISVHTADGVKECGLVVDSVSDVVDLDESALRPAPTLGSNVRADYIENLATVDSGMLILLNADELVSQDLVQSMTPRSAAA